MRYWLKIEQLDAHTLEVVKKSASSMVVKVAALFLGLVLSVALARFLGTEGFGVIALANRIVNILIVFGLLGVRQVIIKEVAIAHAKGDYRAIGNIMHSAYWLNGSCTLLGSVLLIMAAPWISKHIFSSSALTFPLMVFLLALTPQVISRIYSSALVGYRKIWQSNLVEQALSIVITSLLLLIIWCAGIAIEINLVAILYVIGRVAVTLSVGMYWRRLFEEKGPWEVRPKDLYRRSTPLFISTLSAIVVGNVCVVILGIYAPIEDVGLYEAASKLALLTSFLLQITTAAVGPKIATLYHQGNIAALQKMVRTITLYLIVVSAVTLAFFINFGENILGLWGEGFRDAYYVLVILSIGQFVNTSTGVAGQVLIMTGHEKQNRNIMMFFVVTNLLLSVVLIHLFGIIGAAYATSVTVIGLNVTKLMVAKKMTGVSTI